MVNLQRLLRIGLALAFNPARIVEDAAEAARRTAIVLICAVAAGLVMLPAVGCAAAGLWIFVQHRLGPVWAALITAFALIILAVIVLLIGLLVARPRERRRPRQSSAESGAVAAAAAALPGAVIAALASPKETAAASAAAGRGFFTRHKGTALLAAAVVGLVLGQDLFRPRRRDRRAG